MSNTSDGKYQMRRSEWNYPDGGLKRALVSTQAVLRPKSESRVLKTVQVQIASHEELRVRMNMAYEWSHGKSVFDLFIFWFIEVILQIACL